MRLIIAGSRGALVSNAEIARGIRTLGLTLAPNKPFSVTEIISGGATGVDTCGQQFAFAHGIPVHVERAQWHVLGVAAGPARNAKMAERATESGALLAFPCGPSDGTRDMVRKAKAAGMRVCVIELDKRWAVVPEGSM